MARTFIKQQLFNDMFQKTFSDKEKVFSVEKDVFWQYIRGDKSTHIER